MYDSMGSHKWPECQEEQLRCYYYHGEHFPGNRVCLRQRQEEEICEIQHEEKLGWGAAQQRYLERSSNERRGFAAVTRAVRDRAKEVLNGDCILKNGAEQEGDKEEPRKK